MQDLYNVLHIDVDTKECYIHSFIHNYEWFSVNSRENKIVLCIKPKLVSIALEALYKVGYKSVRRWWL